MTTQAAANETKSADGRRSERHERIGLSLHPLTVKTVKKVVSNQAMLRMRARPAPALQAKLSINPPDDVFEHEADQVADRVMRMTDRVAVAEASSTNASEKLQRKCSCGSEGSECAACTEKKEEAGLQRSPAGPAGSASPPSASAPPIVHQVLSSPGQLLDPATRAFMEARFGRNFSGVRVHADSRAADSARSVSALAYTVGSNIVFGRGRYSPGSETGRRLLAHELTHVLQQSSDDLAIQREEAKFDVDGTAGEVEKLVCSTEIEDGEHQALVKLDAIVDTKNLLNVTAKLYDTWEATQNPRPLKPGEPAPATCTAFAELNADLKTDNEATKKAKAGLSAEQLNRLMAAFDAARVHKLRNPISEQDKGTSPTLSEARERSDPGKRRGPVRIGDWGEDPAGNTWVMHSEGIRTFWTSSVTRESGLRSAQWLGKNVGNFGGNKAVAKRMTGSFKWGRDNRAIYFSEEDSKADLFDAVDKSGTIGSYIRSKHTSKAMGDDPEKYIEDLKNILAARKPPLQLSADDPVKNWTGEGQSSSKWLALVEAFRTVEGWTEGKTYNAGNIDTASSKPEDAALVAYYKSVLGVPAAAATQPSQGATPKP